MFIKSLLKILNVDDLGNRWVARIILTVLLIINMSIYLFPENYSDLTPVLVWTEEYAKLTDPNQMLHALDNIPLSQENLIYIGCFYLVAFISIVSVFLYAGLFIKDFRLRYKPKKNKLLLKPARYRQIALRFLVIFCVCILLSFPMLLFLEFATFILLILLPYLLNIPAAYISGDYGFFRSISRGIEMMKGYFLLNMRTICVLGLIFGLGFFIIQFTAQISDPVFDILFSFLKVWMLLSLGRYIGISYSTMMSFPFGLKIEKEQEN